MSQTRIAYRYAKSLLDLASDQGQTSAIVRDVESIKGALENKDLLNLVKSPIINATKKLSIFKKIFGDQISQLTSLFLTKVIQKGRENIIPEILNSFEAQYNESQGIVAVHVTAAKPLTDEHIAQIKSIVAQKRPGSKDARLSVSIDASLIGGFIIDFENQRLDNSVKSKLENLKSSFK